MPIARLDRTVLSLSGADIVPWLEGLITNSITDDINFAALLTPQGKIIADFFVIKQADDLLIDTAAKFAADLIKRLKMYRLRAKVEIGSPDISVYAAWDGTGEEGFADPRHQDLGRRIYSGKLESAQTENNYDRHRLTLGIPDSMWDFDGSQMFPADANMDLLSGVDFKKGCFVGQEVVSRMKRKTTVRKRMLGFTFDGDLADDKITAGKRQVGDVLHTRKGLGMALVRLDRLKEASEPLRVGDLPIAILEGPHGNSP